MSNNIGIPLKSISTKSVGSRVNSALLNQWTRNQLHCSVVVLDGSYQFTTLVGVMEPTYYLYSKFYGWIEVIFFNGAAINILFINKKATSYYDPEANRFEYKNS